MAIHHEKMKKKPKKSKTITKGEHFEDVARDLFKVPKTEISEQGKKP
jgi:hypothetical protein